jgi:hypothetical protein
MSKEIAKNDNLALWESLQATDPKYTKPFKSAGGFSGTAVNGTYILKRLTEAFGPCGKGWRFVVDDDRVEEGHTLKSGDKARLHIVRGHLEYLVEARWCETSPQFGQTMLVGENKYRTFTDEEAPKKSITDCISKCAVLLGIAADVHLGMFDDNKYVNQRKAEEAAESKAVQPPTAVGTGAPTPNTEAPPKPADKSPPTKAEIEAVKVIYNQVYGLVQGAKDPEAIDDVLRANRQGLRELENISPTNFQRMKDFVAKRRGELNKAELNDDMPEIEDMGR